MPEKFLHETVLEEFGQKTLRETDVPTYIRDNLNPAFELRPYQEEASYGLPSVLKMILRRRKNPYICYSTWQPAAVKPHHGRLDSLSL